MHVRSIFVSSLHGANAKLARTLASVIALSPLVLASPALHAETFTSSANCSLSTPAFCETFNQGPSAVRGRGGDLDPSKWSTARLSGEIGSSGQGTANPVA